MKCSPLLVLVTSLALAHVPGASAEVGDWAVVPATNGEMPAFMERVVADVTRELERHGRHVWQSHAAAVRFQDQGSSAAVGIAKDALEKWDQHSRAAIRALTRGEHATAFSRLDQAERLSRSATEDINRSPERALRVLDTCLYKVRALLETDEASSAAAHASECVVLVPNVEPATLMHPPRVLALYQRAREQGRARPATLVVESAPTGCIVRVNGVRFGETPLRITTLSVGEYGVQVECDGTERGRIHSTNVGPGTTKQVVDDRFDRTVRTEPILRLEYSRDRRNGWRADDARDIAELLPAHTIVIVSALTADTVAVGLVTKTGSRQGCSLIPATAEGPSREALAIAIRRLIEGKCGDVSVSRRDTATLFNPGI